MKQHTISTRLANEAKLGLHRQMDGTVCVWLEEPDGHCALADKAALLRMRAVIDRAVELIEEEE